MKLSRLLIVGLVAMILAAPATAADGRHGGAYANLSAVTSTGAGYAGDLLLAGKEQLASVVTELR